MDVDFELVNVTRHSCNRAIISAVLWPLMRKTSCLREEVIEDARRLLAIWRRRLVVLKEAGWADLNSNKGKLQFARNCPPTGIVVATNKTTPRPCRYSGICPWCWARDIKILFKKLEKFLPARGAATTPSLHLLEISNHRDISRRDAGIYLDSHMAWLEKKVHATMKDFKCEGAYYHYGIYPRHIGRGKYVWRLKYTILALLPITAAIPLSLKGSGRMIRSTFVYKKKDLIPIVKRIRSYPIGLMYSKPELTMMALNARRGLRTSALLGKLRGV